MPQNKFNLLDAVNLMNYPESPMVSTMTHQFLLITWIKIIELGKTSFLALSQSTQDDFLDQLMTRLVHKKINLIMNDNLILQTGPLNLELGTY